MSVTGVVLRNIGKIGTSITSDEAFDIQKATKHSEALLNHATLRAECRLARLSLTEVEEDPKDDINLNPSLPLARRTLEILSHDNIFLCDSLRHTLSEVCRLFMECAVIEFDELNRGWPSSTVVTMLNMVDKVSATLPKLGVSETRFEISLIKQAIGAGCASGDYMVSPKNKDEPIDFEKWTELRRSSLAKINSDDLVGLLDFIDEMDDGNWMVFTKILFSLQEKFERENMCGVFANAGVSKMTDLIKDTDTNEKVRLKIIRYLYKYLDGTSDRVIFVKSVLEPFVGILLDDLEEDSIKICVLSGLVKEDHCSLPYLSNHEAELQGYFKAKQSKMNFGLREMFRAVLNRFDPAKKQ